MTRGKGRKTSGVERGRVALSSTTTIGRIGRETYFPRRPISVLRPLSLVPFSHPFSITSRLPIRKVGVAVATDASGII